MLGTKRKDDFEPCWQDGKAWLCTVEFLPTDNPEARLFAAEIIEYRFRVIRVPNFQEKLVGPFPEGRRSVRQMKTTLEYFSLPDAHFQRQRTRPSP
jgi:hypothetical protein